MTTVYKIDGAREGTWPNSNNNTNSCTCTKIEPHKKTQQYQNFPIEKSILMTPEFDMRNKILSEKTPIDYNDADNDGHDDSDDEWTIKTKKLW